MKNIKLAIIDCIGLNYDGSTLTKKGIGGSESSIISIARELTKIGLSVTIFNDCVSDETTPGLYDGVQYHPIRTLAQVDFNFDIVISQRTVIPFTPENLYDQVRQPAPRDFDPTIFKQLQRPHQLKILWQQDTFIWGDHILENLVLGKHIDEIFCLSDWHIAYTANCAHGDKRNFEVLKNHIWHTRNAINRWIDWVDVKHKDPNLFVYNASITKGMVPLVEKIWPKIKAQLPNAKLKIIGGYYKFRDEAVSDAANKVMALQDSVKHDTSIQFTGIIPQPKIAEIMATASYNLFPGAYPETSGISSIESINYNTPIIGTRFGAMEESGTEAAGYYMDYAIEPNGLFPWINQEAQVDKFVNLVLQVVKNPYLHQQKQYACNLVKDVSTWDTVALQWKQHFYSKLCIDLSQQEQDRVDWINYRVHKVFGRRFSNTEEIKVVSPPDKITMLPNKMVKVAIVDIVGMAYDGDSLTRGGLGGSESAVILNSQELAKIGFDVTVFNACDEGDNKPGVYNGVSYRPLSDIAKTTQTYDVLISSRVVTPFITEPWYGYPQTTNRKIDYRAFEKLRTGAKLRALWMHDTFCWGDDILEDLVVAGAIDELWTLSDFHAMYVMNCSHPRMRNYEVLRKRVWTTRNGIVKYFDNVDIDSKDPNLFIFNANMSKGLDPLLNLVWPGVKANLPDARLTVIGGFYKLGAAFAHDNEESEFNKIAGPHFNDPTIEFTGIISQREVAKLSAKASFFIYPAALPETYGISTMEALYANTPLLTCRFGALEETAGPHSYYIDYASVPNGLFPKINAQEQADKFVKMVVDSANDRNSHRQRMESLDEIKDIAGWDVVSLEWKEHIYAKLGLYLSKEESHQASYTKAKYQKIFNRRFSTPESWLAPKITAERKILIVSPFYNAQDYIKKCILSVAAQNYTDYEHWMINDASTDNSVAIVYDTIKQLPKNIQDRFKLINNTVNVGAVANQMYFINHYNADPMNTIVMFLDGDDSLTNSSDIFTYYNQLHNDYDFTYGSSWSQADSIPLVGQPYPPNIKTTKQYRSHRFNWNMPYTHLRTFKIGLAYGLSDDLFKDDSGNWFRAGGDTATFYNILERADPNRVHAVADIVYNYNDLNPINDYKVNAHQQNETVNRVIEKRDVTVPVQESKITQYQPTKKRILIAIPTNRNIEAETFKSIYNLDIPDGYEVEFQYFWGYQVEQVRNLIAHWVIQNQYDYLFAVDSDMAFPRDTLRKMLAHDVDMVSGIYIQRIPGRHTIEIMRKNEYGGVTHVPYEQIQGQGLVPIDGCGFGCVLIKNHVFKTIPYPQFIYKSALDHANTVSEDVYFCQQAISRGMKIWADTSILCDHIGSYTFRVENNFTPKVEENKTHARFRELRHTVSIPAEHTAYLHNMKNTMGVNPKVIYDIGACVLHWTDAARTVWPDANYTAFEAMDEVKFIYNESGIPHHMGVLCDSDYKKIEFFQNTEHPGGNSYYRENPEFSPPATILFSDAQKIIKTGMTLDTIVQQSRFPMPDLIKMDVQGAEMDILKGATNTLANCQDLILEIQHVQYNQGAPLKDTVIKFVESLGFKLVTAYFATASQMDGDYHFTRRNIQ